MTFSYENKIVDNIFTRSEFNDIWAHIGKTPEEQQKHVLEFNHLAFLSWLPENVVEKIKLKAEEAFGRPVVLKELSFARYAKFSGINPKLFPHLDETFKEPRLTFDIQVESTIDWPIIVEGEEFLLKDNQALTFSGTHQVHWRPKIEFGDDDYVDMVFCHFTDVDAEPNSLGDEHYLPLIARRDELLSEYNARG